MARKEKVDDSSLFVKIVTELLKPGANKASMIFLNSTLVLIWTLIIISLMNHYFNIHVIIIGVLTTGLVIFVNLFAVKINSVIPEEVEDSDSDDSDSDDSDSDDSDSDDDSDHEKKD